MKFSDVCDLEIWNSWNTARATHVCEGGNEDDNDDDGDNVDTGKKAMPGVGIKSFQVEDSVTETEKKWEEVKTMLDGKSLGRW